MADQYDISPEQRKIAEERAKRRLVLRNEFLKLKSDPFRHATGEGGYVFDPAIQRFHAMKVSTFEHFKPTFKNVRWGLMAVVLPMAAYAFLLRKTRGDLEERIRKGEVAYKDRLFKLI